MSRSRWAKLGLMLAVFILISWVEYPSNQDRVLVWLMLGFTYLVGLIDGGE